MHSIKEVRVSPLSPARFEQLIGEAQYGELLQTIQSAQQLLGGRIVWNVNSTAVGGGVAEMLHSLLSYTRGAGIDTRWMVIGGDSEFFLITKRIHNGLHGEPGDGGALGPQERRHYEETLARNATDLAALVKPNDIVLLHDPQTAGLVDALRKQGARVVWRCHVGHDTPNEHVDLTWAFLRPYLEHADAFVFSRETFIPDFVDRSRTVIISPSIDAFSPKNQEMGVNAVRAILSQSGLVVGDVDPDARPTYMRQDGTPGRVDRVADVLSSGPPPSFDTPLVVQVSRWDRLKDPIGVMQGFAEHVRFDDVHLIVAGPSVRAVADDPEGKQVLDECEVAWRKLPPEIRRRVDLAALPMGDIEENAAIVNALQRQATVVVQKSIREGFGLTVAEAMWKGRPVVASGVGGIQQQIEDGSSGVLLDDPADLAAFGAAVQGLLEDPARAAELGRNAHERVREHFLAPAHLTRYVELFHLMDGNAAHPAE